MFRNRIFAAVLTVVMTGGSACTKGPGKPATVKVGEFASMTGATATFGQSSHKGVQMATDEWNARGGILGTPIELVTLDNQSKAEEARLTALRLINEDKVVALLGEVASSRSLAVAPEAQRYGVPMISPASTNPGVTETGDYVFRACFIDPFQGSAMAKFAYNDLGFRRAAILFDVKNDYSVGLKTFFIQKFRELGGEIVLETSYSQNDAEFRAQLTQIRNAQPEFIFLPGYYNEFGLIARQARELGLNIPMLGGDGWDSDKTVEIGGEAVNGHYFSNHYAADDPDPKVQEFISRFRAKYNGQTPDAMAVLGYDAAGMLYSAIERAGTTSDRPKIRDALAQTRDYDGVSGKITMDAKRNARKSLIVLQIRDGKFVFHKSVEPD